MEEAEITREQLIRELGALCQRLAQLESSTTHRLKEFNDALTIVLGYIELALYDVAPDSVTCRRVPAAGNDGWETRPGARAATLIGRYFDATHWPLHLGGRPPPWVR